MDAIPHSAKEQLPDLKEDSLERQINDPKKKEGKSKLQVAMWASKNNLEHSSMYYQLLTDGSDHT